MNTLPTFISSFQIPLKWYSVLLLVIPSLIGALLVNPKTLEERRKANDERDDRKEKKQKLHEYRSELKNLHTHADQEWAEKRRQFIYNDVARIRSELKSPINLLDILFILWQIILTVLMYAAITSLAILAYSVVRYFNLKGSNITVWSIWKGFAVAYITSHWREAILLPCLTAIAAKSVKSRQWKAILCIVLAIVLIISPIFTNTGAARILPMEDEILAELKSNPIFDYSISDIEGFQGRVHGGYIEDQPTTPGGDNTTEDRPDALDLDINMLTIEQLIRCMFYLSSTHSDLLQTYVERAYTLYSSGVAMNDFDAATILYYYAWYHESAFYLDAASRYEAAESYWNAVLCLWQYCKSEKGVFMELTGRIVDDAVLAIDNDQASSPMDYCEDIMIYWYDIDHAYWPTDDFDRLCATASDEVFLNIVNASIHVKERRETDASRVEHILSLEKYHNCPKALLLSQYYGHEHLNELYQMYINHSDWFEPEDQINLAWLFYERGENQVAVSITENGAEDVLIRTEAFLQSPDDTVDLDKLYVDISTVIESGAGEFEPRLRLAQIIIGNRLGIDVSYEGLSEICEEVFDTNSAAGLFIISSLKNVDGRYDEAFLMTRAILEKLTAPDPLYYRTLFLQADTLMGMASMPEYAGQATECYERAATILETVRDSVEGDYVTCLERLVDIYRVMGRDDDMNRTLELLARIRGGD